MNDAYKRTTFMDIGQNILAASLGAKSIFHLLNTGAFFIKIIFLQTKIQ